VYQTTPNLHIPSESRPGRRKRQGEEPFGPPDPVACMLGRARSVARGVGFMTQGDLVLHAVAENTRHRPSRWARPCLHCLRKMFDCRRAMTIGVIVIATVRGPLLLCSFDVSGSHIQIGNGRRVWKALRGLEELRQVCRDATAQNQCVRVITRAWMRGDDLLDECRSLARAPEAAVGPFSAGDLPYALT
jgi:hypothetical protein